MFNKRKLAQIRRIDRALSLAFAVLPRRPLPQLSKIRPQRVLVLEAQLLGDLVMTLPVLSTLRELYPRAEITLAAHAPAEDLAGVRALVDGVVRFRVPWTDYDYSRLAFNRLASGLRVLRSMRFDLAVDCRGDLRNNLLLRLTGASRRVAPAAAGGSYLLTDVVPVPPHAVHLADLRTALLRHLGFGGPIPIPSIKPDAESVSWAGTMMPPDAVILHPGSSRPEKRWPVRHCAELLRLLAADGQPVVLVGSEADTERLAAIREAAGPDVESADERVRVVTPLLARLDGVLGRAGAVVAMDSGPAHLAAAVGAAVVALFGPTAPEYCGPIGDGRVRCLRSRDGTMAGVDPADVYCAVAELRGRQARR